MKDKIKLKHIHIGIIILGSLFLLLPIFHESLWFDEAYSVGLANHNFIDIWTIGGHDVHPILYYFFLHTIYLIFRSKSIIIYRLFSWLCFTLLGIIGYTHIKKDFNEKVGLIFSFLVYFLPVSGLYSGEIRMYALGMLLGTLMSIHAYRIYKNDIKKSTLPIFGLCSLALAYTHYYGLMLAGIINLALFIYLIKEKRQKDLKKFIIIAIIQVILYIPWLIFFVTQLKGVSSGFWINITFPGTLYEILTVQYLGKLSMNLMVVLTIIFYIYLGYLIAKNKKDMKIPLMAIVIYLSIIVSALLVSLIMWSAILYYRYMLIITGLLIFALSFILSKGNKYVVACILLCIFLLSSYSMKINIEEAYDEFNDDHINYVLENIKDNDIIIYSDMSATALTTRLYQNRDIVSYFYNKDNWGIHEAYKAFEPYMYVADDLESILDNYHGRIWIVESNTNELQDKLIEEYGVKPIEYKEFYQKYKSLPYTIELVEKR
ncbi:MAG: glycosyltransferase family 39 protein [Bacilli bacterium]|nr:glycosyltransferase family 39 protein [Bacilli bacterium]